MSKKKIEQIQIEKVENGFILTKYDDNYDSKREVFDQYSMSELSDVLKDFING